MCFCFHMMSIIVLLGILLNTIQYSSGERRITDGKPVKEAKRYVAYLLKAPRSPQRYDAWLCGGAIVAPLYIITSAACIEDVQFMYAIAGYSKYVRSADIDNNECTKNKKKKVVFTCIPKEYTLDYEKVEKWSYIDIGVVKVESPYDFADKSYEGTCTHIPNKLPINFEPKYQEPGIDVLVLGWGHSEIWRQPSDTKDHNMLELHYAATLITKKETCHKAYPQLNNTIEKYMICTDNAGNIDDTGELIVTSKPDANGCNEKLNEELQDMYTPICDEFGNIVSVYNTRKKFKVNITGVSTRRHGICQNDHGGPLVTWVGSREILVGVASVFRVGQDSKCQGPYLFTSTQCNGAFLDCIINGEKSSNSTRRNLCNKPPKERGFHFVRRSISWRNHPDGPADNERIRLRPQRPIRNG